MHMPLTYVPCLHAATSIHDEIALHLSWKTLYFSSMEACRSSPVLCLKKCAATCCHQKELLLAVAGRNPAPVDMYITCLTIYCTRFH